MLQIKFCTEIVGAAIGRIDAEKEKKDETDVIANAVMSDVFKPYVKQR